MSAGRHIGTQREKRSARAADWLFRLRDPDVSSAEIRDWLAWCDAAPENKQEFARLQAIWQQAGAIERPPADVAALLSPVASARVDQGGDRRFVLLRSWLVAASVSSVAVAGLWWFVTQHGVSANDMTLATTTGVNRDAELPDGTKVTLAAGSRLTAHYDAAGRGIVLEQGEAFFAVKKDPGRPFVVHALDATVTAIGTAFNVRAEQGLLSVAVTEGVVDVERPRASAPAISPQESAGEASPSTAPRKESVRVAAGYKITLAPGERKPTVVPVAAERAIAWRTGVLQFEREPLSSVIAAVNRYAAIPIALGNERLGRYHYTGTVAADRIEEWLRGLPDIYPVSVSEQGKAQVVIESLPR